MRKSFGAPGNLIAAVGFYNSEHSGDEKISPLQRDFIISEGMGDEKTPEAPGILIAAVRFYNSECLSDEKIPQGP